MPLYDLIIGGGGPAALAAAFFAAGKRLDAVMIYEELGGKAGWLESPPDPQRQALLPGTELAQLVAARITAQAGRSLDDHVLGVEKIGDVFHVSTERHGVLEARTVLVATGAAPLPLRVPGADRFLEHGLGYSATTYAHLVAGQRVAPSNVHRAAFICCRRTAHPWISIVELISDDPGSNIARRPRRSGARSGSWKGVVLLGLW